MNTEAGKRLMEPPRRSGAAMQEAAQDIFAHFHDCTSCEEYSHAECRTCKEQAVAAERARCLGILRDARDRTRQGDTFAAILATLDEAVLLIIEGEAT